MNGTTEMMKRQLNGYAFAPWAEAEVSELPQQRMMS